MNKFIKYPVDRIRGRVFIAICMMTFFCGVFGAIRITPPLCRIAVRRITLARARSQWQNILNGGVVADNAPVCNLKIPNAGIDVPVLGHSTERNLTRLPCISATCPDQVKSPVIVAHRDLHFRPLKNVRVGDRVHVTRSSGERVEYQVLRLDVVDPDVAEEMAAEIQPGSLMLVTCYPFRYIGPAPERFVVVCVRC